MSVIISSPDTVDAIGGLLRAADGVRRELTRALEPHGLSGQQYNVLRILRGAHPAALPTLSVAARLLEKTPGITRLLDKLEAKQLVARVRDGGDRRQVYCSVTAAGLELLTALDNVVQNANAHALEPLDSTELTTLIGLLEKLSASPLKAQHPNRGASS